ncbi:MAG: DUF5987 family protein [Actinomycetes bacterium]
MTTRPAPWPPLPSRREVMRGLAAALAAWQVGSPVAAGAATDPGCPDVLSGVADPTVGLVGDHTRATVEAFADTLVPGEKPGRGDRVVAGATGVPGAVQAGVVDLLTMPEAQVHAYLPSVAVLLDAQATVYAAGNGGLPNPGVPPFVGLPVDERSALCSELLAPGGLVDEDQQLLTLFALLVFVAFHTAGHLRTAAAVSTGHPGLRWIGFPKPEADGSWRFPEFSYGAQSAGQH